MDFNSKDYAIFRHYLITLENIKECRDYNMFSNIHDGFCLKEFPTELEIRYSYVNYILET